jgi:hypothetical protein
MVEFSAILARLVGVFSRRLIIDNFIGVQRLSLCFGIIFFVFFLANCLLNSLQNNHYYVQLQLVSELQHFPETSSSSVSMAGSHGRGGHRGQVLNEEAPHCDCNVQDVILIGDLRRQVTEFQRLVRKTWIRNAILTIAIQNSISRTRITILFWFGNSEVEMKNLLMKNSKKTSS